MVWVRSEYAGELAVVFTWLSALIPWSMSVVRITDLGPAVTVVNIRFVFGQFHYLSGTPLGEQSLGDLVQFVHKIPSFVPADQRLEARLWVLAAVVYLGALLFSVVYYAHEDLVTDRSPVDPVRFLGGSLAVVAALLAVSSVLYFPHQFTAPLGTVLVGAFAVLLLRVDRT